MRAMRNRILAALVPLCLLAAGCGDDTSSQGPDLSMPADLAVGPDLAMRTPDGVVCGQDTCPVGQSCCVKPMGMSTTAMCTSGAGACTGGATLACDGPEDCGGGTASGQFCCGTIELSGGGPDGGAPMFGGGSAMCTTTCAFDFDIGARKLTTRLCKQNVDCMGLTGPLNTPLDKCCSSTMAPGLHFCATAIAQAGITCP